MMMRRRQKRKAEPNLRGCDQICLSYAPSRDLRGGSAAQLRRCHSEQPERCSRLGGTPRCRTCVAGDLAVVLFKAPPKTPHHARYPDKTTTTKKPLKTGQKVT